MDPDIRPVAWFDDPTEAEIALSRLEAEGFDAWVIDTSVVSTGWSSPGNAGGIALATLASDAHDARALLDALEAAYEPEIPDEFADQARTECCPDCGSASKVFDHMRPAEIAAQILFKDRSPALTGPHWRCRDCGRRWLVGGV